MFSRAALPRVLPFLCYIFFIVVADLLNRVGYSDQQLQFLYPLKIALVLGLLLYFWRDYTELAGPLPGWSAMAGAVLAGVLVLVLWINLDASWMMVGTPAGFDPRRDGQIVWSLVLVRIAGAALVVPVMEELFWRSFLMRWIERDDFLKVIPAQIKFKAFVVAVILFGFEHNLWLAGIVAGAVYTLIYMRTGQLWLSVLAHAITNGVLGVWIVHAEQWTYW